MTSVLSSEEEEELRLQRAQVTRQLYEVAEGRREGQEKRRQEGRRGEKGFGKTKSSRTKQRQEVDTKRTYLPEDGQDYLYDTEESETDGRQKKYDTRRQTYQQVQQKEEVIDNTYATDEPREVVRKKIRTTPRYKKRKLKPKTKSKDELMFEEEKIGDEKKNLRFEVSRKREQESSLGVAQSEEWGEKMWQEVKEDQKWGWGDAGGRLQEQEMRRRAGVQEQEQEMKRRAGVQEPEQEMRRRLGSRRRKTQASVGVNPWVDSQTGDSQTVETVQQNRSQLSGEVKGNFTLHYSFRVYATGFSPTTGSR